MANQLKIADEIDADKDTWTRLSNAVESSLIQTLHSVLSVFKGSMEELQNLFLKANSEGEA